jgi:hypothetical protein
LAALNRIIDGKSTQPNWYTPPATLTATLVAPLPASIASTVTPSALKYPLSCATKNGACVPWMIQSSMILTFLVSALAVTTDTAARTRDSDNIRPSRMKKVTTALSERSIIDYLHLHSARVTRDEETSRMTRWTRSMWSIPPRAPPQPTA